MLRQATWQGQYRPSIGSPSPLSAIEMALKRLERFERLEHRERDSFLVSAAIERLEQAQAKIVLSF